MFVCDFVIPKFKMINSYTPFTYVALVSLCKPHWSPFISLVNLYQSPTTMTSNSKKFQ